MINKKNIAVWFLFDWAITPFPVIVTTFIFSAYFTEHIAPNKIVGTEYWGNVIAAAGFCIAFFSPFLGGIADFKGHRKRGLGVFALLAAVSSAMLWYAKPSPDFMSWTLLWVFLGTLGVEISTVFYNAMLKGLAPKAVVGRLSGWAWGFGYTSGVVSLLVCLFVFIKGDIAWIDTLGQAAGVRLCGPFVGIWIIVFSLPMVLFFKERQRKSLCYSKAITLGARSLFETFKSIRQYKNIFIFLLSRMLYMDGLLAIFAFGGIYAAGVFHMTMAEVVIYGVLMNLAAGLGAVGFAWVDNWIGSKLTVMLALFSMFACALGLVIFHSITIFWVVSLIFGLCVGPVQASSRSLMTKLAPADKVNQMFGLYALSGRATSFVGPLAFGQATYFFGTQRAGVMAASLFLFAGALLLMYVKHKD
jgi:UMF1 family MFS transporter